MLSPEAKHIEEAGNVVWLQGRKAGCLAPLSAAQLWGRRRLALQVSSLSHWNPLLWCSGIPGWGEEAVYPQDWVLGFAQLLDIAAGR